MQLRSQITKLFSRSARGPYHPDRGENEPGDREFLAQRPTYEAGFRKSRKRDFTQAKILFSQFIEFYPDDALAKTYLERALE
jgi:TolA-binding protein